MFLEETDSISRGPIEKQNSQEQGFLQPKQRKTKGSRHKDLDKVYRSQHSAMDMRGSRKGNRSNSASEVTTEDKKESKKDKTQSNQKAKEKRNVGNVIEIKYKKDDINTTDKNGKEKPNETTRAQKKKKGKGKRQGRDSSVTFGDHSNSASSKNNSSVSRCSSFSRVGLYVLSKFKDYCSNDHCCNIHGTFYVYSKLLLG